MRTAFWEKGVGKKSMLHVLTVHIFDFQNRSIFVALFLELLMYKEQLLQHPCMKG